MSSKKENITVGDVFSEHQFYTVVKTSKNKVTFTSDSGKEMILDRAYVEQNLSSAMSYNDVKEVTRTELSQIVLSNPQVAIGLSYQKKPDSTEISKRICELYPNKGGKIVSKADFTKKVNATLSVLGDERVMYGRHSGHLNEQGRLSFIDMKETKDPSKAYDTRMRLVDTRTLNWVIVGNTMYKQKK